MDTFSHALWGKGLFGYRKFYWYPVFFGIFPDMISFGVFGIVKFLFNPKSMQFGKPELSEIPVWVHSMYDFSHSMVIAMIFVLIFFKFDKNLFFASLAWPFHIILDFFTHSIEYFPTPILWPISDYKFDGIPWSNKYVFGANLIGLIVLFSYRFFKKKYK